MKNSFPGSLTIHPNNVNADLYEQARKLEKRGKFKEAKEKYIAANAEAQDVCRCNYYIVIEDKDFDAAIINAIAADSPEMIDGYFDAITNYELKRLAEGYVFLKRNPLNYDIRKTDFNALIKSCIPEDLQPEVKFVILQTLNIALRKHKLWFETSIERLQVKSRVKNKDKKTSSKQKSTSKAAKMNKAKKRSCQNCILYKNNDCGGLNGPCRDYKHSPVITDEEKNSWPTEMGPYVTGYGSGRKR